jgi:hypothetical protein
MHESFTHVRSQAAFVRSLLDEVERVAPSVPAAAVSAQLVEELARLGCRFLEIAGALSKSVASAQTVLTVHAQTQPPPIEALR